jgi:hypothetical protein
MDIENVARINHDFKKPLKFPVSRVNYIELKTMNESLKNHLNTKITYPSGKTTQMGQTYVSSSLVKLSFQSEEIGKKSTCS